MQRQDLTPVITRARQKIETDFNQQRINQQLATLLQAL
jgi:colanic acid/amylovoran biosynthesis glycosyltransferase